MKLTKITNTSKEGTLKPYFPGWLQERFGDCFAQICVVTTLKLKNAVKDVARAMLGQVPPEIEGWTKRFEMPPQGLSDSKFILGWDDDEGHHQGSIERDQALQAYIAKYPGQWEVVKNALALPRQLSRHASAFIVASKPISEFIPTTSVSGVKVTAFSGPEVEAVGGLKMDWLVVLALNDIQACMNLIRERSGIEVPSPGFVINGRRVPAHRLVLDPVGGGIVDIWNLPKDLDVFADISTGKTETVFQFNTHSAQRWLKCFNYARPNGEPGINSIEAMAAFTALDRPGPLNYEVTNPDSPAQKHSLLVEYSRRVRGLPGSKDILPIFDKLLPETYGLIVFQEGLQKVYQNLTGCTGAEAEEFRRLSAKKLPEKMAALYTSFVDKAAQKIGKEAAQQVWTGLLEFSAYCFNNSHATAYCVISYACAWLKHHYPLEWWCAVLKNATKDEIAEKFWPFVSSIVDLPDLNLSKPTWAIVDGRIRAPLDLCYGIGETAHKQLSQYAPYSSLDDFCEKIVKHQVATAIDGKWGRSAINIGTVHTLTATGIMDSLFPSDKTVSEKLDLWQESMKRATVAAGKKYVRKKSNYPSLDALGRYQTKKDLLPVYSEDIRPLLKEEGPIKLVDGMPYYNHQVYSYVSGSEVFTAERIVGLRDLLEMESGELPEGGFRCVVVAYVESKEAFPYQNGTKVARKFALDACGFKRTMVYWPGKDGRIPIHVDKIVAGSIVVAILSKTDVRYGFSIREIELLKAPPVKEKDDGKNKEE